MSYPDELEIQDSQSIFVTQLNENNNDYRKKVPIVKDSPKKLVETGLNTYQETLLISKQSDLENVDLDLIIKRNEYKKKMTILANKKAELIKQQQNYIDKINTFESFIKENDAKKKRALARYQNEVKLVHQEKGVLEDLTSEISEYKKLHKNLKEKVESYKKYEAYLLKVIDMFPQDYIKISENILGGLIMRYNTLSGMNEVLVKDMIKNTEKSHEYSSDISKLKEAHSKATLQNNYRLSKLYLDHEQAKDKSERAELNFRLNHGNIREEVLNSGLVLRSIDNITKKCSRKFDDPIPNEDLLEKLGRIEDYITTLKDVIEIAKNMKTPTRLDNVDNSDRGSPISKRKLKQ